MSAASSSGRKGRAGVSDSEIDVRPAPDVWHTDLVTSGRIIIGRRVGT